MSLEYQNQCLEASVSFLKGTVEELEKINENLKAELEQVKAELSGVKGCSCHLCKHQLKGTCPHPEKSSIHGCRYFEVRGMEANREND